MLTKVTISKKMSVPSDEAWEAISKRARRRMTLERGGDITDRILHIDPTEKRLTYERVQSPFPVTSYRGTVEVFKSFDSLAIVVWTVDFESDPEDSAAVAETLRAGIGAGVDGMERDLLGS